MFATSTARTVRALDPRRRLGVVSSDLVDDGNGDPSPTVDPSAGKDLDIPAIIKNVSQQQCRYMVITGGEPMINAELPELAAALKKKGKHITIETAGIKFIPGIDCDLMSISPKTSNSGQKTRTRPIKQLINNYPYQLKFVVESSNDLPEIQRAVKSLGKVDPTRIMLMPQARTRK